MASSARCLCIMYHYVGDRQGGPTGGVRGLTAAEFAEQVDALCEVAAPIDWPTFAAWRRGQATIPNPSFLLTFDDGLSDHVETVMPILDARDIRGLFFVPTACVLEHRLATAHQIHLLIGELGTDRLALEIDRGLTREGYTVDTADLADADRIYAYETPDRARLKYLLHCALPIDLRNEIVERLFTEHVGAPSAFAMRWYLSRDEVRILQNNGHTIGGHGHAHEPLGRLPIEEQIEDFTRCARGLSGLLGRADRPFAYPFGNMNDDVRRSCANAGFVNGFTTRSGWIDASAGAHELARVDTIHAADFLEKELACKEA